MSERDRFADGYAAGRKDFAPHLPALAARIEALEAALNYVADMTYCGADAEWHFKPGYDPQAVLDALAERQDK